MVSNDVLYCLMLSADVKKMSKKFLKGDLSALGEPRKMTPSSETEIILGVVRMGKL